MGCACGGPNHLMVGSFGHKGNRPLCGEASGYMWERDVFERRVAEGNACTACMRALERDDAIKCLKEMKKHVKELCDTYNNPYPDASFERCDKLLEQLKDN